MIAEDPSVQAEVDTILSELSVAPSEEDAAAIAESRRQQFPVELSHLPEPPAHLRAYRTNRITPTAYPKALIEQSLMLAEAREEQALADSYIVTFHDEAFPYALQKTDSTAAQRVHSSGATLSQRAAQLVTTLGGDLYYTWDVALPGFAARLSESQVKELLANPEVKSVERDAVITLAYDQVDLPTGLWGLDRIDERNDRKAGAPDENLYRYARRGEGVHAYVIDTGVRGTHSEFTGRMGVGFYIEGGSTTDTYGHGTHVAGTIAGSTYGIAKAAMIHPVRVSQDGYWSASEAIECIEWIINQHASTELAVANMSFRWYPSNPRYDDPIGFETAINSLIADGVVVVCAAGNEYGTNIDYDPCYPAAFPVVITVGATDSADARASFSNIGTLVDVWAPGVGVLSAGITNDSASASMSGTSMAAPHVAGVAARFLQVCPTYTHTQIRDHIVNIASVGKITGDLGGSENKLLFMNGWFYPFHKLGEWENSDLPYSDQWVYIPEMSSWVWSAPDWYPWFWVDSIQDWYHLQTDTPFLTFFHYPPSGWPPAIVWYQE